MWQSKREISFQLDRAFTGKPELDCQAIAALKLHGFESWPFKQKFVSKCWFISILLVAWTYIFWPICKWHLTLHSTQIALLTYGLNLNLYPLTGALWVHIYYTTDSTIETKHCTMKILYSTRNLWYCTLRYRKNFFFLPEQVFSIIFLTQERVSYGDD